MFYWTFFAKVEFSLFSGCFYISQYHNILTLRLKSKTECACHWSGICLYTNDDSHLKREQQKTTAYMLMLYRQTLDMHRHEPWFAVKTKWLSGKSVTEIKVCKFQVTTDCRSACWHGHPRRMCLLVGKNMCWRAE